MSDNTLLAFFVLLIVFYGCVPEKGSLMDRTLNSVGVNSAPAPAP